MKVGIGLPNTTPGCDGALLIEWARRTEEGPFSSLAVLDRLVYHSFEPLTALAAAAAVTQDIGLATMIVIGPLRNTALLAKQAASVDALAGGRLTLALAVGARLEDYEVAQVDHRGRGRRLSEQLAYLRDGWSATGIGPAPPHASRPRLLVGGLSGEAFARMARYTDGYAHGGGPPRAFASAAAKARAAWSAFERPGRPLLWGQAYFALGDEERGAAYLRDYYAFTGPFAEKIAAENLTSPRAIRDFIRGYEEEGCDELMLLPTVSDIAQVERLAEVVAE
jgi:alkanesulfonate monooxygenase SsuD/methylene tetrahydromethanopterin reductase-like flavin-dependent oxidoreductase (luciferase family)